MPAAEVQAIVRANPGMTNACIAAIRRRGLAAMPVDTERCFRMDPARRWTGLWRRGFEVSRFCPAPATACTRGDGGIWISGVRRRDEAAGRSGLFSITFIGRRTAVAGAHGHLNAFRHEIVVDRMIALRRIGD